MYDPSEDPDDCQPTADDQAEFGAWCAREEQRLSESGEYLPDDDGSDWPEHRSAA